MPGTSTVAHWAMSAPSASIGHVLSTLVVVRARTAWASLAPVPARPTSTTVTSASPYAASLLPK